MTLSGFNKVIVSILRTLARLTDPDANRSGERAWQASRRRVARALAKDSADDWRTTGDDLRRALHGRRSGS